MDRPLGTMSLPYLLRDLKVQPVGQVELRSAVDRAIQRPLTSGIVDVVREAGGLTQNLDAPCRDKMA